MNFRRGIPKKVIALQELKHGLDPEVFLRDVLGVSYMEDRGDEIIIRCPLPFGLHRNGDQNPSAAFNRERLVFNCFTCSSGGDIFWLAQTALGLSPDDAVGAIRGVLRPVELDAQQFIEDLQSLWEEEDPSYAIPEYSAKILQPWKMYSPYLDERGVSHDVQRMMQTGIDLENRDRVRELNDEWIEQPRLVIPHFFEGKLRGWVKRKLSNAQLGPKYKNTPSFPRRRTLYNWDHARLKETVVVVESPLSTIRLLSEDRLDHDRLGFVSTFGDEVNDEQCALLRSCDQLILYFDGDWPGWNASVSVAPRVMDYSRVRVASIPPESHRDPGDLPIEEVLQDLEEAIPASALTLHPEASRKEVVKWRSARKGHQSRLRV